MKVLLFDIDGTLALTGGAGLRAMSDAFYQLFGVKEAFKKVNLTGRTDTSIIRDALEDYDLPFTRDAEFEFRNLYYDLIRTEIKVPNSEKYLMPGIKELLQELEKRDNIYLGLLTGNWETSGRTKLGEFDINHYFRFGAFADDSEIRNELLPYAVKRFERLYDRSPNQEQVYVIGDTPSDINCAKPHNAISVAVGAAKYSVDQLSKYNPDYLFADFSDVGKVLEVVG